ncbi:MAG: hypothetical protein GY710_01870 [Desulfobacteraceae bacterium]|nr:hypothetical protein [Desulfobacteraceae bacterium]
MKFNQVLINDYMGSANENKQKESFFKDFLEFPERYEPTYQAKKNIVADYILPLYGHNQYGMTYERMHEWVGRSFRYGDVKDLKQSVEYAYSSTAGRECAVLFITASVRDARGNYKKVRSGGIAFSIESSVQLKRIS